MIGLKNLPCLLTYIGCRKVYKKIKKKVKKHRTKNERVSFLLTFHPNPDAEQGSESAENITQPCANSAPKTNEDLIETEAPDATVALSDFERLHAHVGHRVEVVTYGNGLNGASVECMDCNEILYTLDNPALDVG